MGTKCISLLIAAILSLTMFGCSDEGTSSGATSGTASGTSSEVTSGGASSGEASSGTTTGSAGGAEEAPAAGDGYEEQYALSNPKATVEAQKLYDYINSVYKTSILSGQQESTWMSGGADYEMNYIKEKTGKLPAIRGLDFMHMDFDGVVERSIDWWEQGGIVTICWHCGTDFTGEWTHSQQTEIADWDKALTEGTPEYETLVAGMDMGAQALLKLQEAGVPVLWRPFHELDGGWFWWSKGGAENFVKLWRLMYDRYTDHWGLNNLIWVLGYSHDMSKDASEWYPGDEYCDVVGGDSYTKGANQVLFRVCEYLIGERKPICFHECGTIPTSEQLKDKEAKWCWFMTWHTDYITKENDPETLKEIYNDEYVITLDELPSFVEEQAAA